jgi:hypothetical protein
VASRRLPPYQDLKQQYLSGATYRQIAVEHGVSVSTVATHLKEGALQLDEWPLQPDLSRAERISRTKTSRAEMTDSSEVGIALQLRWSELGDTQGKRSWCQERGLRYSTVCEILSGKRPKLSLPLEARVRAALNA